MALTGELTLTSPTLEIEWKTEKFTSLANGYHRSSSFPFAGDSWFLFMKVHLDIGIFIKREIFRSPINIDISTSFKTSAGKKIHEENRHTVFDSKSYMRLIHSIKISDYSERQSDLLPSDILTVMCTLRLPESSENENVSDLQILKLSQCSAPITGGQEVILLCGQVNAKDIEIVFYEDNGKGERIWSDTGKFSPEDVHRETAISFKTPPYKTTNIQKKIECFICLRRPSDGTESEPKEFSLCPPNQGLTRLSEDLKNLFLSEEDSDFVLKVGEKTYRVHKAIVKSRSSVFRSMIVHDMKEKNEDIVDIEDCDSHMFKDFLLYLYAGKVDDISKENVFELYYTSDKYDVKELKIDCVDYILNNLNIDIVCAAITLAAKHSEKDMLERATEFFIENADDIFQTVPWQQFLKDNPTYANELIIKAFKSRPRK